ncbi:uncharacterized protein LOC117189641 [Drosophila miranda]|uniref:uncharacterized protein LOC117189641 n=1 Tax=Drosophila miranda TaxID=7229 RepID=UPI00143F4B5C|nr:uncharacterized protein LOC117189641 [Drosophila miranda]
MAQGASASALDVHVCVMQQITHLRHQNWQRQDPGVGVNGDGVWRATLVRPPMLLLPGDLGIGTGQSGCVDQWKWPQMSADCLHPSGCWSGHPGYTADVVGESSVLAGLVVGLPLLFCDDDGVTSWPSVDGSVIGGASELGPTCNKMLRLVARQVLERLICECIDSGSLDVDGDDDRDFKFRPFGRNWMELDWLLWTCAVDCQERRQ